MYEQIMIPLDGSELAEAALPHGAALAKSFAGRIIILSVSEPTTMFPQPVTAGSVTAAPGKITDEVADLKKYLDGVAGRLKAEGIQVRTVIREGDAASEIVDYAAVNKQDIIVMSTHGRSGIQRWVYGSVADKILRSADVPVLLIRSRAK